MTQPEPSTYAPERERSPYGRGVTTGQNSQLFASVRPAKGGRCIWARPGAGVGAVGDFRADGYEIVQPKDTELLGRGQYTPEKKDFGVYVDFDPKADRVIGAGGMVLMYAPQGLLDELEAEQRHLGDVYRKKAVQGVTEPNGEVSMTTEVSTKLENLADM